MKRKQVIFVLMITYICMNFVMDQFFDIFICPSMIPVIGNNCFMWKRIRLALFAEGYQPSVLTIPFFISSIPSYKPIPLFLKQFFPSCPINPLSANPTKWSNTLFLFECVWPFCGISAWRVKPVWELPTYLNFSHHPLSTL